MKQAKIWLLFVLLFIASTQGQAQSFDFLNVDQEQKHDYLYTELSAIVLNDKVLANEVPTNESLITGKMIGGKLTVQTVDRTGEQYSPLEPIGFRVAIKYFRTNTLWMYSDEILYEADLGDIMKKCELGDRIIFMTVDRKHRLPRHEVLVSTSDGGC